MLKTWPNIANQKHETAPNSAISGLPTSKVKVTLALPQVGGAYHTISLPSQDLQDLSRKSMKLPTSPNPTIPHPACPLRKPRAQTITPALVINRSLNSRPSLALGRKAHSIPGFTSATRIGFSFRSHCSKGFSKGTSTKGETSALLGFLDVSVRWDSRH